jgi:hypothetical protein
VKSNQLPGQAWDNLEEKLSMSAFAAGVGSVRVVSTAGYDGAHGVVVVWVQHINSTWSWVNGSCYVGKDKEFNCSAGVGERGAKYPRSPTPLASPSVELTLPFPAFFAPGTRLSVQWFDTWGGEWIKAAPREDSGEEQAQAEEQVVVVGPSSVVRLRVPGTLDNDTAAVLRTV